MLKKTAGILFVLLAISLATAAVTRYLEDEKRVPSISEQRPPGILGQVFWTPELTTNEQKDGLIGCLSIVSIIISATLLYPSRDKTERDRGRQ